MALKLPDMLQLRKETLTLKVNLENQYMAGKHQNKLKKVLTNAKNCVRIYLTK